jgi:adenylate cyclase
LLEKLKKIFDKKFLIIFSILFVFLVLLRVINPSFIVAISNLSLDSYQKIFTYKVKDTPVIIADIDEKSLGQIGQFPWNRKVFGNLINKLNQSGAAVIAFDVFFSEADKQNPEQFIQANNIDQGSELGRLILQVQSNDQFFINQIQSSNIVMPVLGITEKPVQSYSIEPKAKFIQRGQDAKQFLYKFPFGLTSLNVINNASSGLGNISIISDTDAIIRRAPLLINIEDQMIPSLAVETLRVYKKQKNVLVQSDESGIKQIKLRPFSVPTDFNSMHWIKFKEPIISQKVSIIDILNDQVDRNVFKDKIVLVGASAQGLFDLVQTPTGTIIPGVEVHANIIENILQNEILTRNINSYIIEFLILILGITFAFNVAGKTKPQFSIFFYLSLIIVVFLIGILFYSNNFLIDISYPIFAITMMFLTGLYLRYLQENLASQEFEKKQMLLKQEREIARQVQEKLFPEDNEDEDIIYAKNIPARDVSGDYYDYIKIDNEIYFTLADVSGKGIKAGILMANAASVFRSFAKLKKSVSEIAMYVNNQVADSSFQGMFITAIIGKINTQTNEIEFINHGHEPMMVTDGSSFEYIESTLPPLGVLSMEDPGFFETTKTKYENKKIYIYTDGVTEGYLVDGSELGQQGFENIVKTHQDKSTKEVIALLIDLLTKHSDKLRDDITCMGITFK